jgi:hypothetical protein
MPAVEVLTFAGIDVSGRELSVALRHGPGDHKPALARVEVRMNFEKLEDVAVFFVGPR